MVNDLLEHIVYDFKENGDSLVNIGFGIDNNYVRPMATAISSVRKNLSENIGMNVHVITDGIDMENQNKLKVLAQNLRIKLNIYTIDIRELKKLPMRMLLPHATYFRLVLPKVIDKDIKKMYYFDADVVAIKNLDGLFREEFENGQIVMAIPDIEQTAVKRIKELKLKDHIYFNAGILAINLPEWNNYNVLEKIMVEINKDPEKFKYFDQDALNLILTKKIKYLDSKYNYIHGCTCDEKDAVILHYAANPKPWKFYFNISGACTGFNKDFYQFYEKFTPWRDVPLDPPFNYKEMEVCSKCLMKIGKIFEALKWKMKYLIARTKYKFL